MRTKIDIDAELLAAAMAATGLPSKRATVEAGLRALVLRAQVEAFEDLAGLGWEGDLRQCAKGVLSTRGRDPRRRLDLDRGSKARVDRHLYCGMTCNALQCVTRYTAIRG